MRLIYGNGFDLYERKGYRQVILSAMIDAYQTILDAMRELEIGYEHDMFLKYVRTILRQQPQSVFNCRQDYEKIVRNADIEVGFDLPFPPSCLTAMKGLWADEGFQHAMAGLNALPGKSLPESIQ